MESTSPTEPFDDARVKRSEGPSKLNAKRVNRVGHNPMLWWDPIGYQTVRARPRHGIENGHDDSKNVKLFESSNETAEVSAETPSEARS